MRALYYPYISLETRQAGALVDCFKELFVLAPLALRPRFTLPKVKFIDPLPKEWQEKFRNILSEYRLFKQTYTDKTFLEYLKFVPPESPDDEGVSKLTRLLRGKMIEKEEKSVPGEVTSSLFLHLAQEYSSYIQEIYQRLEQVRLQEQALKEIMDTTSEVNIPEIPEVNLNYIHPDEDLRNFVDKILKAFNQLLATQEDKETFPICVTDDEVVHRYLKEHLKDIHSFSYTLYFPVSTGNLASFWETLLEVPCEEDHEILKEILSPYLAPLPKQVALEILLLPNLPADQALLSIENKRTLVRKKINGVLCLWKGESHAI
ncbi:MAG: hypothetical protein J7M03_05150 [Candidatus Desulfofervidaceae bacterium]|nr:hypothetical protein [Candidatus Desulfofervidaceae bacterium]